MAEFPALPFFTDAYLADTRHLTTEEHGAYLLLLMCAWRTRGCTLKDDNRTLARIAGLTPIKWKRVRPSLSDFFTIERGEWRQKKLTAVYQTVSKKVEQNRLNGAKGGRARSRQSKMTKPVLADSRSSVAKDHSGFSPGWNEAICPSDRLSAAEASLQATKTKNQNPKAACKQQSSSLQREDGSAVNRTDQIKAIAAAAGYETHKVDSAIVSYWYEAGSCLEGDIVPTIHRLREREEKKTGQAPKFLSYYSSAVLEARNKRVGAIAKGRDFQDLHPARPAKITFNLNDVEHWRRFLGDASSKFRGDYLSGNWQIPGDHPEFLCADLGPDPRHRVNLSIPKEIYEHYSAGWGWRPIPANTPNKTEKTDRGME